MKSCRLAGDVAPVVNHCGDDTSQGHERRGGHRTGVHPLGGRGLFVPQLAGVPDQGATEEVPLLAASPGPQLGPWLIGNDTAVHPAHPSNSSQAQPVKLSILMAAYNEESTITRAIDKVLNADCPCEIELIVVNDGSTDATPALLSAVDDPRVTVHHHPANQGKGAALLAAASLATGTHILPFDADLEYSAEDISRLLEPVLNGRCEVVYGVRVFGCNTVYRTYIYALGNRLLTRVANILFNAHLTDLHTCLKLMPLVMLRTFNLREKGFGLDSEITASILRTGIRPFEVPISYYGRSRAEGKKIKWHDAVECAWILLRVRLRVRLRQEPASKTPVEGGRAPVAIAGPNPQLVEHVATDGDEFATAAAG
jgi:dolichol-phosphate hexosyltransferase